MAVADEKESRTVQADAGSREITSFVCDLRLSQCSARFHALNSGASRSRRPFIDQKMQQANQDQGGESSDDKLRLKRPFERETRIVIRKEHE